MLPSNGLLQQFAGNGPAKNSKQKVRLCLCNDVVHGHNSCLALRLCNKFLLRPLVKSYKCSHLTGTLASGPKPKNVLNWSKSKGPMLANFLHKYS